MGLLDFFKRKKPATKNEDKQKNEDGQGDLQEIQYETKIASRNITTDKALIEDVVNKIVNEDPFKRFYGGKTAEDFSSSSKRIYKYDSITTMNIDLNEEQKNKLTIYVEGISLGDIPQVKADDINQYREKYLMTAYAYVTGGEFKEYSEEDEEIKEGFVPFGLDVYLQFT